ncbi:MAG: YeeE/YedE family protein [Gammaproteobacteria bacterium]|nr:YeeE/YedE family protein [Gammaproteobacteria bacterium]
MNESTTTDEAGSSLSVPRWVSGFKEDYNTILVREWSPYLGAILLVVVNSVLLLSGLFWGVFGGLKLWGDWFNHFIGLGAFLSIKEELENPLLQRISLMDITLILGAFSAALMSRQFAVRRPPPQEFLNAAFGGSLMGVGATLAGGCTTGGFFTPLMFQSASGWAMWAGLLLGAFIGLKQAPPLQEHHGFKRISPWLGFAVLAGIVWWATSWYGSEDTKLAARGIVILSGFAQGFILHRSRFCTARAFREPFMTAEGEMTKAMILALAIGIPVSSLLLQHKTVDPFLAIPPTFWIGALGGGMIFGFGMVFAGGCATGSMWRMGEGHLKLWVAVFFFAWIGSIFSAIAKKTGLMVRETDLDLMVDTTKVGYQAYMPDMFGGWGWVYLLSFVILAIWYALVRYNESTEKFTVL